MSILSQVSNEFPVENHGNQSSGNVGRSNLPCESAYMWATLETDPTPVVTRVEPTPSMVPKSHTRGGRSSVAISDVGIRPEIEFRQEPEIDNPA